MLKEIMIGANNVKFLSNGATPLFYKQIFGSDLLKQLSGDGLEIASDKIPELGYVMAMQAQEHTIADMMKLNYEGYIDWLSKFEPLDVVLKSADIANVYLSDSIPSEEPKKKVKGEASE